MEEMNQADRVARDVAFLANQKTPQTQQETNEELYARVVANDRRPLRGNSHQRQVENVQHVTVRVVDGPRSSGYYEEIPPNWANMNEVQTNLVRVLCNKHLDRVARRSSFITLSQHHSGAAAVQDVLSRYSLGDFEEPKVEFPGTARR